MKRFALASLFAVLAAPVLAADPVEFKLAIQDHKFEPAELKVPAGQKIKLVIENRDDSAEEFESHELNREKIVGPKATITVFIGPLEPGRYPFFGEFHIDTAQGAVVAE
jgi:plastocyanin